MSSIPESKLAGLSADWERSALPDPVRRALASGLLGGMQGVSGRTYYPFGLDPASPEPALWQPYKDARQLVEAYPQGQQEAGCQLAWILHDPAHAGLEIALMDPGLPSKCPRFANRACPRMEPMGHEPTQSTCNYWDYAPMQDLAPQIEIYPEWQRFDCHKYYPLFQAHLVGEALARSLRAVAIFAVYSAQPGDARLIESYARLTSRPYAFQWRSLAD